MQEMPEINNMFEEVAVLDDDFEAFLRDFNDDKTIKTGGIQDETTANYYVSRLKKNKDIAKMYEEKAKKILDDYELKVRLWRDKKIDALLNDNERILQMLENYYMNIYDEGSSKKIRLPEGNIGFYKTPASATIDKDNKQTVLEFLHDIHNSNSVDISPYIKMEEDLNVRELKKAGEINEQTKSFKLFDCIVPGVNVKPSEKKFSVR